MCLPPLKHFFHKFEFKLINFLWNDCEESKKLALIKWDNICKTKVYGGLGIKDLLWQNEALGAKLIWHLHLEIEQKWANILYNKYLIAEERSYIFKMKTLPKGPESWNLMVQCRHLLRKYLSCNVGKGEMLFLGRFMR